MLLIVSGYESPSAHAGSAHTTSQPVCISDPRADPGAVANDATHSDVASSHDDKYAAKEHAGKKYES